MLYPIHASMETDFKTNVMKTVHRNRNKEILLTSIFVGD